MSLSLLRIRLRSFARAEDGAVSVDWVVLTAGVVSLALAIAIMLKPVIYEDAGGRIAARISEATTY